MLEVIERFLEISARLPEDREPRLAIGERRDDLEHGQRAAPQERERQQPRARGGAALERQECRRTQQDQRDGHEQDHEVRPPRVCPLLSRPGSVVPEDVEDRIGAISQQLLVQIRRERHVGDTEAAFQDLECLGRVVSPAPGRWQAAIPVCSLEHIERIVIVGREHRR